jgi:major membrane immunogen (membrane-anchored lipoprotein)
MRYTYIVIANIIVVGLLLSSCSSKHHAASKRHISKNDYVYNDINFGPNRDEDFKKGVRDGCKTTAGDYTKNSERFKNNQSYRVGWADGRMKCEDAIAK